MSQLLPKPAPFRATGGGVVIALLLLLSSSGCMNIMALSAKILLGESKSDSKFKSTTGRDLEEGDNGIIVHCTTPLNVMDTAENLASDVEGELIRRMKHRKMAIIDQNRVVETLDSHGGRYDTQVLMNDIPEARFLFEIRVERYSIQEPHTPTMYRGRCSGTIVGYEFEGGDPQDKDSGPRRMAQVFEQEFDVDYPNGHPIPKEQMSESSFQKKFVNELTKSLGTMFYEVTLKELYSHAP